MLDDAKRLQDAGAFCLVLEGIPADLATQVSQALEIPTVGIGAGAGCDGQVLVMQDLLGLDDAFQPKFVRRFAELAQPVRTTARSLSIATPLVAVGATVSVIGVGGLAMVGASGLTLVCGGVIVAGAAWLRAQHYRKTLSEAPDMEDATVTVRRVQGRLRNDPRIS